MGSGIASDGFYPAGASMSPVRPVVSMVRPRSGRFEPLLPVSEPGGEATEEGVDDNLRREAISGTQWRR